jgi:polyphosphate kinase
MSNGDKDKDKDKGEYGSGGAGGKRGRGTKVKAGNAGKAGTSDGSGGGKASGPGDGSGGEAGSASPRLKNKEYEAELRGLHAELVALQEWVKKTGAKICIVFEGRDTAGKGGTIKAITERVSPRVFRVVALPAPSDRERSQMFIQRYIGHFPAAGEVVIFDRSWYNRAGIERVLGFAREDEVRRFLDGVSLVERTMVESGIILLKYWLEVSPDEQTRRLESRINDPRKVWKLSDMDLLSYSHWWDYERARDDMFRASDSSWAPWYVAHTDDKKRGRLNIIAHLLSQIPYESLEHRDVTLPKRQKRRDEDARVAAPPIREIPTPYG